MSNARSTGLAFDPQLAVRTLRRNDPPLAALIARAGPFRHRPPPAQSPFEVLARAIVYQQLSGKAAATIYRRLRRLAPGRHGFRPANVLALSDREMRSAGLSANKCLALRDLAAKTLDGTVPAMRLLRRLPDEEIITRLTEVRGIGRWTVEMLLIFRLGRPDVLPVDDLGVRKGFMQTYGLGALPSKAELSAHAEKWRPYRSVGSWYMWRALDPR
jgi:3-methyladenine DNA glycosylase/8-oxoguanine DNA glycosylase